MIADNPNTDNAAAMKIVFGTELEDSAGLELVDGLVAEVGLG